MLDCVAPLCDYVLLMLISPGYASSPGEGIIPYAIEKIRKTRKYLEQDKSESKDYCRWKGCTRYYSRYD